MLAVTEKIMSTWMRSAMNRLLDLLEDYLNTSSPARNVAPAGGTGHDHRKRIAHE